MLILFRICLLFICLAGARQGLATAAILGPFGRCGVGAQLQHVGSSSLASDQAQAPCTSSFDP